MPVKKEVEMSPKKIIQKRKPGKDIREKIDEAKRKQSEKTPEKRRGPFHLKHKRPAVTLHL